MEDLKKYMRDKFIEGYEGHEIVITLLALVKDKKLKKEDIFPIMDYVYMGNKVGVHNALIKARTLVDNDLIDCILKGSDNN